MSTESYKIAIVNKVKIIYKLLFSTNIICINVNYSGIITKDLAACVNLIPNVTSIYKWKGEVNEDSEILMVRYII